MKSLLMVLALSLTACSGVQLEGIKYVMPNGQLSSCVPHPEKPDWMQCSYMDGKNEVIVGVKRDMISGR